MMISIAWIITLFGVAAVTALFISTIMAIGLAGIEIAIDKFFDWKNKK